MPIVCTPDGKVVNGIGRLEMLAELKADICDVVYVSEDEAKFADAMMNLLTMEFNIHERYEDLLRYPTKGKTMTEIFDPSSAIGSAGAGFVATIIASIVKAKMERDSQLLSLLKQRTEITDDSSDKASARDGDAGRWIRRLIYFGCAFSIIVAPFIFAFFQSIPVEVEQREILGGWLWGLIPEWTSTTFHKVQGFYLPDSIQRAFISYLIPFYLGRGVAK